MALAVVWIPGGGDNRAISIRNRLPYLSCSDVI